MDDKENNVSQLHPDVPPDAVRIKSSKPYTTPAAAVGEALKAAGFNDMAVDAGLIELTIVAEFGQRGCMFHQMRASKVYMTNPLAQAMAEVPVTNDAPAPAATVVPIEQGKRAASFRVLEMLAEDEGVPPRHYVLTATASEMALLDSTLRDATDEELHWLVDGDTEVVACYPEASVILNSLLERAG